MSISLNHVNSEVIRAHKRIDDINSKVSSINNEWYSTKIISDGNHTVDNLYKYKTITVMLELNGLTATFPISLFKTGRVFNVREYNSGHMYGYSIKYINDTTIQISGVHGNGCRCSMIYLR